MKRFQFGWGVVMATFAAGPILAATWIVDSVIFEPPATPSALLNLLAAMIAVPLTALVGAPFSLIPNLIGGAGMAALGASYPATRQRKIWAMAGAILAMAVAGSYIYLPLQKDTLSLYARYAITGAICALIVRYGTRWSDESA
ncbi:hypothetical protein [Sphingomonas sp.]|uniref:hypothetical protein n=1 Tax=Sphingomonas sp. TaxID=28214 RepID=UPI003F6F156C